MTSFNPEMLILAREARELTQTQLARELSIQQAMVSKIEAGLKQPADFSVDKMAEVLGFPVDFFSQQDRVFGFNSAVFFHRKRQALPDRVLRKLHAWMNITRMRIARLLRSADLSPTSGFQRIDVDDYAGNAAEVAKLMRATWMIPHGPVRSVTETIESAGGVVVRINFGTKQADAISEWIPGFPPIFLLNADAGNTGRQAAPDPCARSRARPIASVPQSRHGASSERICSRVSDAKERDQSFPI